MPELFDKELEERILHEAEEALIAESKIVDWMVNGYEEERIKCRCFKGVCKK